MPDIDQALRVSSFALEPYRMSVARGNAPAAAGAGADWFGPLPPLAPIAPKEVAGRQFDFPPGFNLGTKPRAYEPIGFFELRALADAYDLVRIVIETRKDQLARLEWTVRPRGGRGGEGDPRVRRIEAFLRRPDGETAWDAWLRALLEDLFVIDAPTLWCERNRAGGLIALHPIDGATIKRVIDDWGRTPAPPLPAYQQVLHGLPAVDSASIAIQPGVTATVAKQTTYTPGAQSGVFAFIADMQTGVSPAATASYVDLSVTELRR
ncbi:MAG TPA: hypothetical protein VN802_08650 [Stellaceae bacterium]|nr:hypothetical protein [Stellaceae bacterium]